jgi:hypothetical protein
MHSRAKTSIPLILLLAAVKTFVGADESEKRGNSFNFSLVIRNLGFLRSRPTMVGEGTEQQLSCDRYSRDFDAAASDKIRGNQICHKFSLLGENYQPNQVSPSGPEAARTVKSAI